MTTWQTAAGGGGVGGGVLQSKVVNPQTPLRCDAAGIIEVSATVLFMLLLHYDTNCRLKPATDQWPQILNVASTIHGTADCSSL